MALCWTLDKLGPLCLTADDCGLVLDAIAGQDPDDPTTTDRPYQYDGSDVSGRRFKLAIIKDVAEGVHETQAKHLEQAIEVLGGIATVEEIEFLDLPYEHITRTILNVESVSAFEDFIEAGLSAELTAPEDHYGPYARTATRATDYVKALRLRGVAGRRRSAL